MAEQKKPIVAFLGPEASYTHQATLNVFPTISYTLAPQTTIEDVFAAVQNGGAYRGVVPFENSSNGSVVFTLDLFANLNGMYPDILVCGESYVTVRHCLLGFIGAGESKEKEKKEVEEDDYNVGGTSSPASSTKPTAKPLADISRIKKLYSHPQAWGQCKVFLNTHLKHAERHDVSSTSRAAELVAQDKTGESAAISSMTAASVFQLDVLAKGIEDREGNCTRFLVIQKAGSSSILPNNNNTDHQTKQYKTLISFTISHSEPGALAHSLSVFATHNLNLTSINTRPSGVVNWNYIFFVELKGRKEDGEEEGAVNKALRDLRDVCRGYRWLGSWESGL